MKKLQPLQASHRLYKIPAKSPGMGIDFVYNFSSVTNPAPPLSVSRSQHSRPFEIFSFCSLHSNILSPLVQRSFHQGSLQRASYRYDFAGFLKPRGEPGSTLLRGRSNQRGLVRLHAGSLLYWKKNKGRKSRMIFCKKSLKETNCKKRIYRETIVNIFCFLVKYSDFETILKPV